jgi:photosynthetic reaction center cytochrome c subunit
MPTHGTCWHVWGREFSVRSRSGCFETQFSGIVAAGIQPFVGADSEWHLRSSGRGFLTDLASAIRIAWRRKVFLMRNKMISARTVVAVLGLTLASAFLAAAQQTAPVPGSGPARVAGGANRTANDQYKDLKVLGDVPVSQFLPSMRFIATSLGVECEFCHMGKRSDETPNKATARQMITMMLAIDKTNFNGRLQVTCYTCHNGSPNPGSAPSPTGQYSKEGTVAFYLPTAPPTGATDEPMSEAYRAVEAKKQADLAAATPSTDQIIAKYIAALGGADALKKVTSRTIISTTELSPNVRGAGPMLYVKEEQDFKAPNLYVSIVQTGTGTTAKGFDGTDSWVQNARGGVTTQTDTALARAKRAADLSEPLDLKQEYTRLTVRGTEKVGDHDAYVVIGFPNGDNPERLYFDTQTGLLLRKSTFDITALGNYTTQTDYDDYRDVVGVKVPFLVKTVSISPADTVIRHIEKVENNAAVDASKFTKPASTPPPQRPAGQ